MSLDQNNGKWKLEHEWKIGDILQSVNGNMWIKASPAFMIGLGNQFPMGALPTSPGEMKAPYVPAEFVSKYRKVGKIKWKKKFSSDEAREA